MSEEVALGQVTVADLQPGDRVRMGRFGTRTVKDANNFRSITFVGDWRIYHLPLTQPVELLSADQDDDDAIREALYESTAEVER